jgi:hypothetical protein
MSMAFERRLIPQVGDPSERPTRDAGHRLEVTVVFTSDPGTTAALESAAVLASQLSAHITLVVAQTVPYPLPLDSPPVLLDFSERRFAEIASLSPVETMVRLYLCRDRCETLKAVLRPHSLVVMGGRKSWWPTREKRLAEHLRHTGHEVIFTELE